MTEPATAPETAATEAAAPAAPGAPEPKGRKVEFDDQSRRVASVELIYPVRVDGELLSTVVIRRLTAGEVAGFVEGLKKRGNAADDSAVVRFPVFFTADGKKLDDDVLDGLDDDDAAKVNEVAANFLPQRFITTRSP